MLYYNRNELSGVMHFFQSRLKQILGDFLVDLNEFSLKEIIYIGESVKIFRVHIYSCIRESNQRTFGLRDFREERKNLPDEVSANKRPDIDRSLTQSLEWTKLRFPKISAWKFGNEFELDYVSSRFGLASIIALFYSDIFLETKEKLNILFRKVNSLLCVKIKLLKLHLSLLNSVEEMRLAK